jgi:hypothetical protein
VIRAVELLQSALAETPIIRLAILLNGALLLVSLVALLVDHRQVLGINVWIKPLKFELSIIVFLATIAVLLHALGPMVGAHASGVRQRVWLDWGFGLSMIVEIAVIALQSARGVRSHMNYSSPLNGMLFGLMGIFIVVNTVSAAWLLLLWLRTDGGLETAVVWGIRLGLLVLLIGSVEGVRIVSNGGHTVGAADGGAGLPFLNWSTRHGDLRVAHFFAIHALQIFPLVGLALAMTRQRVPLQVMTLVLFVTLYIAAVWWLFAQAMRGVPGIEVERASVHMQR